MESVETEELTLKEFHDIFDLPLSFCKCIFVIFCSKIPSIGPRLLKMEKQKDLMKMLKPRFLFDKVR